MRVAVVGLGAAGCRAALALHEAGIHAELFEARDRLGGRLSSRYSADGEHLYEAGGEWLDSDHVHVKSMLQRFGLEPASSRQWPGTIWFDGKTCPEDEPWPEAALDLERIESAYDFLALDLEPVPWDNVLYPQLDEADLAAFLDRHCLTHEGRWLAEAQQRSDEGDDPQVIGLLGWLCSQMKYEERIDGDMSSFRIPGGGQRLCEKMINSTGMKPKLSTKLAGVDPGFDSVTLRFEDAEERFDRVILTLPPTVLRSLEWTYLSEDHENAWEAARLSRSVKIALEFSERYWKGSARFLTNLPIQQTWELTPDGQSGGAAIGCYICGDEAERWTTIEDPVGEALRHVETLIPGAEKHFIRGEMVDWIHDPYSLGGFPYFPPGFCLNHAQTLSQPLGRVHFAGDATSSWVGFIEGALDSGLRAAEEVIEQCKNG